MVGEQLRSNLGRRVDTVKDLLNTQIDLTKNLVKDAVNRVNPMSDQVAPTLPGKLGSGGFVGLTPGLIDSAFAYGVLTKDNIEKFAQENSKINRSWIRG